MKRENLICLHKIKKFSTIEVVIGRLTWQHESSCNGKCYKCGNLLC